MPAGKVGKKAKRSGKLKRSKASRGQLDDDAGKLRNLDLVIQEQQRAQFYGNDTALDGPSQNKDCKNHESSLKALENLAKCSVKSKNDQKSRNTRDLHALDTVLSTLSKMEVAPTEKSPADPEIDV